MIGIVIMEKNLAWLAKPRISFETLRVKSGSSNMSLPCFHWPHVSTEAYDMFLWVACSITERILSHISTWQFAFRQVSIITGFPMDHQCGISNSIEEKSAKTTE